MGENILKRKNFILFIIFIFILISVLLVSCGPKKKYAPVASVITRRKLDVPFKKSPFGVGSKGLTGSGISVDSPDAAPAPAPAPDAAPDAAPALAPAPDAAPDAAPALAPAPAPVPDDPAPDDPAPADETSEQRMQKEKQKKIGEIKSGILSVAKHLSTYDGFLNHYEAWSSRNIIPAFSGFSAIDPLYNRLYNLNMPRSLFFKLTYEDSAGSTEYLASYKGTLLMRKFYLALEYNDNLLRPFVYVYGKLSYSQGNNSEIFKLKNNIVKRLIKYAEAYYINVYRTLRTKANRLNVLSLGEIRLLKSKLSEIEIAKEEVKAKIIQNFVEGCKQYEPYSIDSKHDVWPHLRDTFNKDFDTKCDVVVALADKIKNILDNIQ
ncbi:Putative membrane spanning protein (plasmid) [Borrelia crocidurae DOU]|uniref:Putative membrane spanning protein n=1 Tax=Borrelia crocidurae DOU TaxID=1293575 RepID=W5SQW6_9SPIR|nr:Putative membrane spanning protein [Borrelia crocidurae DOU]